MLTTELRSITVALVLLISPAAAALPPAYTLQTGLSDIDIEARQDDLFYLAGQVLVSRELSFNSILDLVGEVSSYRYSDSDYLDSEVLFLEGTYHYTPRAGFRVPTYSASLRFTQEYLSDDNYDAATLTLIAAMSYRINDLVSIKGGIKAGTRDADENTQPTGYFANLDYRYSPAWLWFLTLGADNGVFTARPYCANAYRSRSGYSGYGWSATGGSEEDCDQTFATLGASYIINAFNTIEISASHREYELNSRAMDGEIFSIDFFHRF